MIVQFTISFFYFLNPFFFLFFLQHCPHYFSNNSLCSKDTVELREHNWVPRKAFLDNGPKTINQIRQDAVKVSVACKVLCSAFA